MTKKIKNVQDIKAVADLIIGKLVKGNLAYFNVAVEELGGFSQAFFTPRTEIKKEQKNMVFVGDYEKLMMLLLSHPNVSHLQYNAGENAVSCVFQNPYETEECEEF